MAGPPPSSGSPIAVSRQLICVECRVPLLQDTEAFFDEVAARLNPARKAEAALYQAVSSRRYNQVSELQPLTRSGVEDWGSPCSVLRHA